MKTFELQPTENNILETFLNDSIGRTTDVCAFTSLLENIEGCCSIGIDGKWGDGKTFFVKQTKYLLDAHNSLNDFYEKTQAQQMREKYSKIQKQQSLSSFVTVYYDAWQHDDADDPILSLVYEIMKENYSQKTLAKGGEWTEILISLAGCLLDRNVSDVINTYKGKDFFEVTKNRDDINALIGDFFKELLPEHGDRLVVFVDELDRCSPKYAIKLLERIKHFFNLENIIFVFSINFLELQKTIKRYYGDEFDSCKYLDRFFDIRMSMPPMDMDKYIEFTGVVGYKNVRECTCAEVIKQMDMKMREASKYLQISKTAAYKYTDGEDYENIRFREYDGGNASLLGYCIIVPILIGLKMTDTNAYDEFVGGKDSGWLKRIMIFGERDSYALSVLLNNDEAYADLPNKTTVTEDDKVEELYNAIFVKRYDAVNEHQARVGKAIFQKGFKDSLLKAANMLSKYSDYSYDKS